MAAHPGGGDPWRVSAEERAKHDNQFFQLKPVSGFITGDQARAFFMQSGLPVAVLGHIWSLADLNGDGKMDKKEFSIAMHLIKKKLERFELPKTLPASLKADPTPVVGSFGAMPMAAPAPVMGMGMGMMPAPGGFGTAPAGGFGSMPTVQMSNGGPMLGSVRGPTPVVGFVAPVAPVPGVAPVRPVASSAVASSAEWTLPQSSKLKYTQMFNSQDRTKKGFLSGLEARAILTQSGLTHTFLAQIWNLSDIDNDGKLTCEEFCLAMHLVDLVRSGTPLPAKLPPDLVPPSYRRGRSGSGGVGLPPGGIVVPPGPPLSPGMPGQAKKPEAFGELMGGFGMDQAPPPIVPVSAAAVSAQIEPDKMKQPEILAHVTFEDKRKANFAKGQAELEKRQAMLREQQQQEEEARLAAERAEHEKREKIRLEQERKKQQQLERHMEQQRQLEHEREEVRRKAMEQREAARRELERQRQLEWERQRRDQLMAEKQREQKQVDEIGGEVGKLKLELEALESKKAQLHTQIDQARTGVTDLTGAIDRMRQSRDLKLSDIETFQKGHQERSSKLFHLQQDRQQLEIQLQAQNNSMDDTLKSVMKSYKAKQTARERLKTTVQDTEIDTATKLEDIDKVNSELNELKNQLNEIQSANQRLHGNLTQKQHEWEDMKRAKQGGLKKDAAQKIQEQNGTVKMGSGLNDLNSAGDAPKKTWSTAFSQNIAGEAQAVGRLPNGNGNAGGATTASQLDVASPDLLDRSTSSEKELTGLWEQALSQTVVQDASSKSGVSLDNKASSTTPIDWAMFNQTDLFSGTPSAPSQNNIAWSSFSTNKKTKDGAPGPDHKKYQAMFQFDARNFDELSLFVGDLVWIDPDQSGVESGWLKGQSNGKEGIFPEAYVEPASETDGPPPYTGSAANGKPASATSSQLQQAQSTEIASPTESPPQDGSSPASNVDSQPPGVVHASEQSSFAVVPGHTQSPTPGEGQSAPEGLQAQALYPWKAKKDNHLTFNKGDTIVVKEQQDMWWSGELAGKIGWFPKSYVKLIGASTSAAKQEIPLEPPQVELTEPTPPVDAAVSFPTTTDGESYVSLFPYQGTEEGDLSFPQGEVVVVSKKDGDWWTGTVGGRTGMFPANYVKEVEVEATAKTSVIPSVENALQAVPNGGADPGSKSSTLTRQAGKGGKKPEIASVIAAYQATGPEQLSLQPGQLIQVRKKSPSGWWEGELQARGQKRKIGWFPANYVKILGGSARNTPDAAGSSPLKSPTPQGSDAGSRSNTPISHPQPTSAPSLEQVVALYNYVAQHADELSFNKGSIINVLTNTDPDWWKGELNNVTGMFPANYVERLADAAVAGAVAGESSSSDAETKRQNYIKELIATEEAYREDMSIVREAFHRPLLAEKVLTEEEAQSIFVNWKDLTMCNTKLVKALRVRKKMCKGQPIPMIGDILCENLPHMTPYIRFCSCQLNAAAIIQRKTENDPKFKEVCKKCCQNPKTKGMPLSSFLLKPMQRITKYPLILEKILQYTPESHPDHHNLLEALAKANEICSQVNEGVQEKDNSDKLEWIQTHVHCDGLSEKLTFNSVTNCLGPRKFLYSGSLYKAKSGKMLVGFLFNDFLLLTLPQSTLGSVASVFSFDIKADTKFKIYRNPIFLNEVLLKKNPTDSDEDPTLFHISHIDRMYSLKAVSQSERDTWVKKIEAASSNYLETMKKKNERAYIARHMGSKGVGRLMVIVVEGCNLIASDINVRRAPAVGRLLIVILEGVKLSVGEDGKSDPYCEVNMGVQEHKTKVIPNTLNPKWNASMQFTIKDLAQDVVCLTVYDRDLFTPNDFLGRTEIKIADILKETKETKGPITKKMVLHEVESGEVVVKLDVQLFENT